MAYLKMSYSTQLRNIIINHRSNADSCLNAIIAHNRIDTIFDTDEDDIKRQVRFIYNKQHSSKWIKLLEIIQSIE
jgi:hypothetical protein